MNLTIQIPDRLQAEFEQRARERYGEAGPARALQEAIALWLETVTKPDDLKAERALNNQVYRELKRDLEREYQGKYVVIAHGALQGAGDTLEQVAGLAPEARHRLVFQVGEAPPGGGNGYGGCREADLLGQPGHLCHRHPAQDTWRAVPRRD